jgi:hypothetical protein
VVALFCAAFLAVTGSASALVPSAGAGGPFIQSDQADYEPGSTVTLTGGNWVAGDTIHILVDDATGHTWQHNADVTADSSGDIKDVFSLPTSFVAQYLVTATDTTNGTDKATTSFTDAINTDLSGSFQSSAITLGETATFSGRLTRKSDGTGVGGKPIKLSSYSDSSCNTVAVDSVGTDTTTSSGTVGNYSISFKPSDTTARWYRARFAGEGGSTGFGPSNSPCQALTVSAPADTTPPSVAITSPADNSSTASASVNVSGTASDASGIQSVTVNGNAASISGGNWSYSGLSLACGPNTITAVATDASSNHNTNSASITVTRTCNTPPHVSLTGVSDGASYEFGSVPNAVCSVTDAEDGNSTFAASLSPITGPHGADGIGSQTASCSYTDAGGLSDSASATYTIVDTTPPSLTVPSTPVTQEATSSSGAAVTFTVSANDAVDPNPSVTCKEGATTVSSGDTFSLGSHTISCTASDYSSNTSAAKSFTITVQDTTPPDLSLPSNITTTATGNSAATVSYSGASATDLVDGSVPVTCTPASGSSFSVGTTTVNCSATDAHGNKATGSFTVTVNYSFRGFFQPVDNLPTMNVAKAGSAIPVKFSLSGNQGLNIFASGSPASQKIVCDSGDPADTIEQTVTAGSSGLSYDASADQYVYVWKSDKAWSGTCRQLSVKLADGTTHQAQFKFTK